MRCVDNLLRDHDDIAAMLRVLSASVERLQQGHYVDPVMIVGIDQFFQRLVAASYFAKEAQVVFPHVAEVLPDDASTARIATAQRAACLAPIEAFHAVVERWPGEPLHALVGDLADAAALCVQGLAAHLETERALLQRLRHHPPDAADEGLVAACAQIERQQLGATGREWYAQLVADDTDIAGTWSHWPSTAGSPGIRSGQTAGEDAPPRQAADQTAPSVSDVRPLR